LQPSPHGIHFNNNIPIYCEIIPKLQAKACISNYNSAIIHRKNENKTQKGGEEKSDFMVINKTSHTQKAIKGKQLRLRFMSGKIMNFIKF
jgi:hypothetical protein